MTDVQDDPLRGMTSRLTVFAYLEAERVRQQAKWGFQTHPFPVWLAILTEELGEASQAYLQRRYEDCHRELVQAAAVLVQILERLPPL